MCLNVAITCQEHHYNGMDCMHELRTLGLVRLDGLMEVAFGPYPGSASDMSIFNIEGVESRLDNLFNDAVQQLHLQQRPKCLGDSAFLVSNNMMTPFGYDPGESLVLFL